MNFYSFRAAPNAAEPEAILLQSCERMTIELFPINGFSLLSIKNTNKIFTEWNFAILLLYRDSYSNFHCKSHPILILTME